MFTQFRMQYPQGSLISEFVTVDHGKYVVRVEIQDKGVTLATALAAAETVEAAEDRARARALEVVGITAKDQGALVSPSVYATPSNGGTAPMDFAQKMPPPLSSSASATEKYNPLEPPYQTKSKDLPKVPVSPPDIPHSLTSTTNTTTTSQDLLGEGLTSVTTETDFPEPILSPSRGEDTLASPTTTKPKSSSSTGRNQIMEKTSQEIKRLGWSTSQGRQHLVETYGKVSRSHLTDEQLQEFLEYLQGLE